MQRYSNRQLTLMACPIIIGLLVMFAIPAFINAITTGVSQKDAYWFIRAKPLLVLSLMPALALAFIAMQKLHLRRPITAISAAFFLIFVAFYCGSELFRLKPYVGQNGMAWKHVLPYFDRMVLVGAAIGLTLIGLAIKICQPLTPTVKQAKKSPFGGASWLAMQKLADIFPENGDIIIGERYRADEDNVKNIPFLPSDKATWGKGGKAPLLTYKLDFGSTHMMFFAGSGGYKTTSTVIPTCLKYQGSIVCLDPSTEVAPIVREARKRLGRKVYILNPNGSATKAFNVLDWLLDKTIPLPQREANVVNFARLLMSDKRNEDSTSNYFSTQAHNLLTGLLAHVIFSDEYAEHERNLKMLRSLIAQPEPSLIRKLQAIEETSPSEFIRETLGVFTNLTEQTFSGVYSTASKDTQWLSLSNYAGLVCGNDFHSSDITNGDTDIFMNIPASILNSYPGIGRVITGAFLNAMVAADGNYKQRVLFVLDEVDLLGYMNILEEARDRGRKYGTSLMLFYQSSGQLVNHFGKAGARSWFESCSFVSYAAIKDLETAKEVSERCGQMTIEVKSISKTVGTAGAKGTESANYQHRPLILPHEIIQEMRQDEQIILMQGQPPIRCGRAIYFRRKEFLSLAEENRFAHSNRQ